MSNTNDITGDKIINSKHYSKEFEANFDAIFRKPKEEEKPIEAQEENKAD